MSLLEQQMQELLLKQRKVTLLKSIMELMVPTDSKNGNQSEVQADQEILTDLKAYTQSMIENLEEGKPMQEMAEENSLGLTDDEIDFVKEMFARATQRAASQNTYTEEASENSPMGRPMRKPVPPQSPRAQQVRGNKDLLTFAMEHKHLNGKRVIVQTKNGKVGGVVTGADMPNLWVKCDTGHTVPVLPEQLTLE